MSNTVIINVTLKSVAPFSCAVPVAEGAKEGRFKNFPLLATGVTSDGDKTYTGIIPAGTIRGKLRHILTVMNMEAAAAKGDRYTVQAVYEEKVGQIDADKDKEIRASLATIKAYREQNPVQDLFGVGMTLESRMMVSHMRPTIDTLPDYYSGVRHDITDDPSIMDMLTEDQRNQIESRADANSSRSKAAEVVKQLKREIATAKAKAKKEKRDCDCTQLEERLAEAEAVEQGFKDQMGGSTVSTQLPVGYWAMPAGLDFVGKIVIRDCKPRDLEMLQKALDRLSQFPVMGAQSARGCGEVEGTFEVTQDGMVEKIISIGGYKPAQVTEMLRMAA